MKPRTPKERAEQDDTAAVDGFMRGVDPPLKPALEKVRSLLRAAHSAVAEGIKWNSPSFRLAKSAEWFATIHLHPRSRPAVSSRVTASWRRFAAKLALVVVVATTIGCDQLLSLGADRLLLTRRWRTEDCERERTS